MTASPLPQRLGAECLGMAFLLATVVGSSSRLLKNLLAFWRKC
jgi:hypothetical protein